MLTHRTIVAGLLTAGMAALVMAAAPSASQDFTDDFSLFRDMTLSPNGGNPYCPLRPGTSVRLEGEDDGQPVVVEITVLSATRVVRFDAADGEMAVRTRIVQEREWVNGRLTQVERRFFASCPQTGNVYCFGEQATQYRHGAVDGHEGSWLAGQDGARPALHMPGSFLLGARYQRELAEGVAMDRAENVRMGATVSTPAGEFDRCAVVRETTPLEPDEEVLKTYAPGVGLIRDGGLVLVAHQP